MVWVYFMHLKYEDNEETDVWGSKFDSCSMMACEITAIYAISHVIHEEIACEIAAIYVGM